MKKKTATALAPLAVGFLLGTFLWGQGLRLKGQFWTSVTAGDDPAPGRSDVEHTVGYIPTLSLERDLGPLRVLDLEVAYNSGTLYDGLFGGGEADPDEYSRLYRLWGRFATERLEVRLGLQKIAFGPARVLRPLMWFDTFDLKDPTGQTEGVGALRLKWYPWPNLALWGWVVRPDYTNYASPGGRIEYTFGPAEVAFTYHHRKANKLDFTEPSLLVPELLRDIWGDRDEERFAFDFRLDWKIGLWSEGVRTNAIDTHYGPEQRWTVMLGGDYTFAWGNGIYVTAEHMWDRVRFDWSSFQPSSSSQSPESVQDRQLSLFMVNIPWGMFDSVMGLVSYDWENERLSNFLMWQRIYDNFSLNTILYANPKREVYQPEFSVLLPESLMGFGNGIQFMIVYNH